MPLLWITTLDAEVVCDKCGQRWGYVTCSDHDQIFRGVLKSGWTISEQESGKKEFVCRQCSGKGLVELFKLYFET